MSKQRTYKNEYYEDGSLKSETSTTETELSARVREFLDVIFTYSIYLVILFIFSTLAALIAIGSIDIVVRYYLAVVESEK